MEGTALRFKGSKKVSFTSDSTVKIPVIAEFTGAAYNIGASMPLRITRVIRGLDKPEVKDGWQKTLGEDSKSDSSYRARIKDRWRSQILGDPKAVYKFYAQQVSGVREVKIIRAPRGAGSTDVIISSVTGLPSEELIENVKKICMTMPL